jgi:hypothetical protein
MPPDLPNSCQFAWAATTEPSLIFPHPKQIGAYLNTFKSFGLLKFEEV